MDRHITQETYFSVFKRFLKFGCLARGGPITQINMIKQELVDEQKRIENDKFNRVLAVCQALPGPEAHELCVYFGTVAKGKIGGLLAGLGFMLPGFLLILLFSWIYVNIGIQNVWFSVLFTGIQCVVVALILRAIWRIGGHSITNKLLAISFIVGIIGEFYHIHFFFSLLLSGLLYVFLQKKQYGAVGIVIITFISLLLVKSGYGGFDFGNIAIINNTNYPILRQLFFSGLKSGLLTFGGAYTVIPFLRYDAVQKFNWVSDAQFLDGVGLASILPAPLVIFATFVGYIAGGFSGAIVMTLGMFLPAFLFTTLFYIQIENIIQNKNICNFLYGITAGTIGIITVTALNLFHTTISSPLSITIFVVSSIIIWQSNSKYIIPLVVCIGAIISLVFHYLVIT